MDWVRTRFMRPAYVSTCDSHMDDAKQKAGEVPRPCFGLDGLIDYGAGMRVIEPGSSSSPMVSPCTS